MAKIIHYFVPGLTPTAEEIAKAKKLDGKVEFVSLQLIDLNGPIDSTIERVAGKVPEPYQGAEVADASRVADKLPESNKRKE